MTKTPKSLEHLAGREGGTYLIITRCGHWGSGTTLEEACSEARKAGARSLLLKNVVLKWQDNRGWQKVREACLKLDPNGTDVEGYTDEKGRKQELPRRPYVDNYGAVNSWGYGTEFAVITLHSPWG